MSRTGRPEARASTTATPKFSWCDGKDEGLAGSEGAPLGVPEEQAGPVDSVGAARVAGEGLEAVTPPSGIGAGHHEVKIGVLGAESGEGLDEQVATLLFIDSAQEEKKAATGNLRAGGAKGFEKCRGIGWRGFGTDGDDHRFPSVQPETLGRKIAFGVGGEEDAAGATENPIFSRKPVEPFLRVLRRVRPLKVRVEHPVCKYNISRMLSYAQQC